MKIKCNNTEELIIAITSLALELPQDIKIEEYKMGIKNVTFRNNLSIAKRKKLITGRKDSDRIRLRMPEGKEGLKKISDTLDKRYYYVTNDYRLPTGKKTKERMEGYSESTLYMIKNEVMIDNIELEYETNKLGKKEEKEEVIDMLFGDSNLTQERGITLLNEKGKIKSIKEICENLPIEKRAYYTAKLIKGLLPGDKKTSRYAPSKFTGIYFSDTNMYITYYLKEADSSFSKTAENTVKELAGDMYKAIYKEKEYKKNYKRISKGAAIIFTKDKREVAEFFTPRKEVKSPLYPSKTYGESHIIPLEKEGEIILKIISKKNYKEKIKNIIYYPEEQIEDEVIDGIIDGRKSIELLTSDFNKVKKIKEYEIEKIHVVCYKWQKEIIEKMLPKTDIEFLEIDKEQEEIIIENFKKNK